MPRWLRTLVTRAGLNLNNLEADDTFHEVSFYKIWLDVDIDGSVRHVNAQRLTAQLPQSNETGGADRLYETQLPVELLDCLGTTWYVVEATGARQVRLGFVVNILDSFNSDTAIPSDEDLSVLVDQIIKQPEESKTQ